MHRALLPALATLAFAILAFAIPTSRASAQESWAVVVATTRAADVPRAVETADHSAAALEASVGGVIGTERAISRVEAGLSEPFRPAPPELARRLGQTVESVLEDVAFGRNQQALDVGQPLIAELDPHLAALGRDDQASSDLANLCLYLVRAHAQKRDAASAAQQVRMCLRLVPDLAADPRLHPPAVRELLGAARRELDEGSGGILAVHAASTDPEGCAIRVNGRNVGRTPWARVPLVPGPYATQIECDPARAGRVHPVQVAGDAPTRITIRARLAEALSTRPAIALSYPSRSDLAVHLDDDVAVLAEVIGAERVLVAVDDGQSLVVRAFSVSADGTRVLGSAAVPQPFDDVHSREAVQAALAGRRDDSVVDPGTPAAPAARGDGGAVASIVLGSLLAAGGIAGLGVGWGLWVELEARHAEWSQFTGASRLDPRFLEVRDALDTLPWAMLGTGAGGGFLLTLAVPFLFPQTDEYPWWSLVIGAGGAALVAVGAWQMTQTAPIGGPTEPEDQRTNDAEFLGAHLIAHGVPLLSVPLVYLVRAATGGDPSSGASVQVDGERAEVRIWGAF